MRHVVITHAHYDHFGSLDDVADRAAGARLYAGALDSTNMLDQNGSPALASPRLRAVADGDEVFGLQVIETPGHTPGHIAVFDANSAVLVAGDALTSTIDGLAGPSPEFTEDEDAAAGSVRKLAALEPRTILVGHGAPVARDAAVQLLLLGNSLS